MRCEGPGCGYHKPLNAASGRTFFFSLSLPYSHPLSCESYYSYAMMIVSHCGCEPSPLKCCANTQSELRCVVLQRRKRARNAPEKRGRLAKGMSSDE